MSNSKTGPDRKRWQLSVGKGSHIGVRTLISIPLDASTVDADFRFVGFSTGFGFPGFFRYTRRQYRVHAHSLLFFQHDFVLHRNAFHHHLAFVLLQSVGYRWWNNRWNYEDVEHCQTQRCGYDSTSWNQDQRCVRSFVRSFIHQCDTVNEMI